MVRIEKSEGFSSHVAKRSHFRKNLLKRFGRDEGGSLIIFSLFLFIMMLMIGGLAVDIMRYETHRARLQSTLDRAVLAAASLDQPRTPAEVVVDYFERAGLGAYIDPADITVVNTLTARRVSAQANMEINTTLMRLIGIETLTAPAAGAAEETASRTEISLVVDVSGSMRWNSASGRPRIDELRDAATDFVNIMQCNPENPSDIVNCTVEPDMVSITLIPYEEQVVAGQTIMNLLNTTSEHSQSHCITFDLVDFDTVPIDPTVLYQRTGHFDPWRRPWHTPGHWTCKTESWRQILPLENDPQDLRDAISNLQASGYTSIDLGMKWGGAFLDPSFQPVIDGLVAGGDVVNAFNDRPFNYTEDGIKKVVVLMTDGVNTTQHYLHDEFRTGMSGIWYYAAEDRYSTFFSGSGGWYYWDTSESWSRQPEGGVAAVQLSFQELWTHKTWEWYERFGWLDNPGSSFNRSDKDSRLDTICDAVKAQNITVFSIGFELTAESELVLENCASSPAHFFGVDGTEMDLSDAFASIARAITALRLVN